MYKCRIKIFKQLAQMPTFLSVYNNKDNFHINHFSTQQKFLKSFHLHQPLLILNIRHWNRIYRQALIKCYFLLQNDPLQQINMKNVDIRICMLSIYVYFYLKRHNESKPNKRSNALPEYSKKQTAVIAAGIGLLNNVDKR